MKKLLIILWSITLISAVFAQQDKRLKGLDKDLNEILKTTKAPGFAVAIVQGKKIIYAKGFGYRDYENKIPVDTNTLFAIGSCTKAFTSSILGQLRQEDKISFDDSPRKYIPELKFYNNEMNNNIIIKDLMSHRTGLPRHDASWYYFPTYDKDSLMHRIEYQEPFTGVRQKWHYNNFMFLTQGIIAEEITGKTWQENIKDRFFTPLGMTRSNVSIDELEKSTNAALGYSLKNKRLDYYHIAAMAPAGSINSSVNEMSNWLITWLNKGVFEGQQIIPEPYIEEAITSQMATGSGFPDKEFPDLHLLNYGYAWFLSSYKGHYLVQHGGNIDGFSASTAFFPSDSIGIVVLTNQNHSSLPKMVSNSIADRILKTKKTDWTNWYIESLTKESLGKIEAESKPSTKETHKQSHNNIDYTGTYSNGGYGTFKIIVKNELLYTEGLHINQFINHLDYDLFELIDVKDNTIDSSQLGQAYTAKFNINNSGDISSVELKVEHKLDPIIFLRTPNTIKVKETTLVSYTGTFDQSGAEIKVYIKSKNKLYLYISVQPEYELVATDRHQFSIKALEGYDVEFIKSKDKSIIELIITQPDGTYKATRK